MNERMLVADESQWPTSKLFLPQPPHSTPTARDGRTAPRSGGSWTSAPRNTVQHGYPAGRRSGRIAASSNPSVCDIWLTLSLRARYTVTTAQVTFTSAWKTWDSLQYGL